MTEIIGWKQLDYRLTDWLFKKLVETGNCVLLFAFLML